MLDLKFSSGLGLGRAGLGLGLVVCGLDYNTGCHVRVHIVGKQCDQTIILSSSFNTMLMGDLWLENRGGTSLFYW
jgi:hypothetical protein